MNSKNTQLNELQEFKIQETSILAGLVHSRELVAIKPIAENLNLDWSSTRQRLERDHKLGQLSVLAPSISADGKKRDMLCLPVGACQDWLWGLQITDKMNVALWEQYKKDLVMTVMMMLKISLEEIQSSQVEKEFLKETAALSVRYIKEQEELNKMESDTKEKKRLVNELRNEILERQLNHSQLTLFKEAESINN